MNKLALVCMMLGLLGCEATWEIPQDQFLFCASNDDCPNGYTCEVSAEREDGTCRDLTQPVCGNGLLETDEVCDYSESADGLYCSADCLVESSVCGDGLVANAVGEQPAELCDDGAENSDSYGAAGRCNSACSGQAPFCGDGIADAVEECDNGEANDDLVPDACRVDCTRARCGDGVVDTLNGESCDLGAETNTDAYGGAGRCNSTCSGDAPYCGDGQVTDDETCDSGDANSDAYGAAGRCSSNCMGAAPSCGDGVINGGETCDDGGANTDDYGVSGRCNTTCNDFAPACGDGETDTELGEFCDDGNTEDGDYCLSDCSAATTVCGDSIVEGDEVCDDGPGNTSSDYAFAQTCNDTCTGFAGYCGDNVENGPEACDDGNTTEEANGCSAICERAGSCGDGILQYYFEGCDDNNALTESCVYGEENCVVCVGSNYTDDNNPENNSADGCEYRQVTGTYCGDGILQQRGMEDGVDTLEWEGCDSEEAVACSSLHAALGTGTATCESSCLKYDTSGCENQQVAFIPAGPFMMGCNAELDGDCEEDELPYREVEVAAFVIDIYEVNAGDYRACKQDNDSCTYESDSGSYYNKYHTYNNSREDHPINHVNYTEAEVYCAYDDGKRLPTEEEWEKAARGVDGRVFPWGYYLPTCDRAIFNGRRYAPDDGDADGNGYVEGQGCGEEKTWPVGSVPAGQSPYGVMDMAGGVWEWTSSLQTEDDTKRVLRGGCFNSTPYALRVSQRGFPNSGNPNDRVLTNGFRCVK